MARRGIPPLVVVTGPDRWGAVAWHFTAYALRRVGAVPVRATPSITPPDEFDGLVIGGGAHVSLASRSPTAPATVAATAPLTGTARIETDSAAAVRNPSPDLRGEGRPGMRRNWSYLDRARDVLELELIERARQRGIPILGICRGAQLLNVAFGGTLYRSLRAFYTEDNEVRSVRAVKKVSIEPGTLLAHITGESVFRVNALHRHAVKKVGQGLRVAARDSQGVIQAIECVAQHFILGVQWHPEFLPLHQTQRRIFQAFAAAARPEGRAAGSWR